MGNSDNIFSDMQNGQTFDKAFYNNTSKTIGEFNDIAYPYIKNKFKWYKLITLPNQLFSLFPLLLIIGFILKSIKNKKIEEKWKLEEELEQIEELEN